jgi:transketolase
MAAMMNGMVLHGGLKVYCATFLMFMEYMRNALRMSAMMKIGSIFVYSHDSIGLGEDGPTHQAVEQLSTMRVIPNFQTWRACDAIESAVSWKMAMLRVDAPTALIFSRQNLTPMERTDDQVRNIAKGGYVLKDCEGGAEIILIATGSEVGLAVESADAMTDKKVRVVSMPSTNAFDDQDQDYKDSVLTPGVKRVAIEAGVAESWYKYIGLDGGVVVMSTFGESAPAGDLFKYFGFTVEKVVSTVESVLG